MSDQSTTDSESSTPAPKPASRWEDFIDIFYTPASVFARRAGASWGVPLLVVTVLSALIFLANMGVMQPIMDAEFARATAAAIKKNPNITAEQMAQFRGIGEKFGAVFIVIGIPVAIFLVGLVLWLVGKLVDAKQTFGAALMVAAYSYVPKVLDGVIGGIQGLLVDPATLTGRLKLSLGVGRFLDPDGSQMMLALLGRVDVFTIWVTILLGIGLSVTGKIPRSRAFVAAAIVWVVGAIPGVLGALRNG